MDPVGKRERGTNHLSNPRFPLSWPGPVYYRLHGSPTRYYSAYTGEYLQDLAARLRTMAATGVPVWCIFDNTAAGAAVTNALTLLGSHRSGRSPA